MPYHTTIGFTRLTLMRGYVLEAGVCFADEKKNKYTIEWMLYPPCFITLIRDDDHPSRIFPTDYLIYTTIPLWEALHIGAVMKLYFFSL